MKRLVFLLLALSLVNMGCSLHDNASQGEPEMTQPNTALDTLEKFKDPKNFLATRPTFDIDTFNKNRGRTKEYRFVREDGVHVYQRGKGDKGYQEELTRPDSHYEYGSTYSSDGRLKGMWARFCNAPVGVALWLDGAGNIVKSKNFAENFLPIEKLRERFLEQTQRDMNNKSTGIDIYDVLNVMCVFHIHDEDDEGLRYFIVLVREKPESGELMGYLLNGSTGEILYNMITYKTPAGLFPSVYDGYKKYLKDGKK